MNDTELLASIILAIETHNSIAFEYAKDVGFNGIRKCNPHNIYWNKDNTKLMLDAVQFEGDSKTGIESFKQFDTSYMKSCIILDDIFTIHPSYKSKSDRYKNSVLGIII
jgi:hypothetical protein